MISCFFNEMILFVFLSCFYVFLILFCINLYLYFIIVIFFCLLLLHRNIISQKYILFQLGRRINIKQSKSVADPK